ncbi:unnamed protein product [Notodromas monacha]|uniref:Uncharacterized protein n=1 Tax=Notodromas monacha TaxID=399045 RepID=A0A7R9BEP8_9CRUS|nr:unnamed protein product [Notodromas monacha]CAG0913920.1 unnamed protein product [Notodromas monacha]
MNISCEKYKNWDFDFGNAVRDGETRDPAAQTQRTACACPRVSSVFPRPEQPPVPKSKPSNKEEKDNDHALCSYNFEASSNRICVVLAESVQKWSFLHLESAWRLVLPVSKTKSLFVKFPYREWEEVECASVDLLSRHPLWCRRFQNPASSPTENRAVL